MVIEMLLNNDFKLSKRSNLIMYIIEFKKK